MKHLGAVLAAAGLAVLVTASSAFADPSGLTGESFVASPLTIVASCPDSSGSSFTFSASGTASGPYAGTFTESGSITMSTSPFGFVDGIPLYSVATVQAVFTIDSPSGQVTGSKELVVADPSVNGGCLDFVNRMLASDGSIVASGTFRRISPSSSGFGLSYDATIETPGGTFEDMGDAGLLIDQLQVTTSVGSVQNSNVLNEAFSSSGPVVRISGAGHVTGGGQIGSRVSFGFNADSDGGLHGVCTIVDQSAATKVKCLDVTSFSQSGVHSIVFGHAVVNGVATVYRIDAYDNAEPGRGVDTFAITTGAGYAVGGTLGQGNIQLHG